MWQRGTCVAKGGMHGKGAYMAGGCAWQETTTVADGKHPAGIDSKSIGISH